MRVQDILRQLNMDVSKDAHHAAEYYQQLIVEGFSQRDALELTQSYMTARVVSRFGVLRDAVSTVGEPKTTSSERVLCERLAPDGVTKCLLRKGHEHPQIGAHMSPDIELDITHQNGTTKWIYRGGIAEIVSPKPTVPASRDRPAVPPDERVGPTY